MSQQRSRKRSPAQKTLLADLQEFNAVCLLSAIRVEGPQIRTARSLSDEVELCGDLTGTYAFLRNDR